MYFVSGISLKVESFSGCHTKKELGPWGTDIVNRISSVLCLCQMKVVYGHHYLDVNSLGKEPAWPFGSDWCGIMLQDSLIWANLLGFCSLYLYPLLWKNLKLLLSLNHVLQVLTNPIAFSMCGPGFCHAVKDTAKVVADRWWRQHEKPDQTCSIQPAKAGFCSLFSIWIWCEDPYLSL